VTACTLCGYGGAPLRGTVRIPGCKGISHRFLVIAAIADGPSAIGNLATGRDVASTRCDRTARCVARSADGRLTVNGAGIDASSNRRSDRLRKLRHHDAFSCCLAGRPFHSVLEGDESLSKRPMAVVEPLRAMGAVIGGPDGGARRRW
jgi:3-phosphoshikimate 1-carboxyvinyltransferase